jgi:hypothetical protein
MFQFLDKNLKRMVYYLTQFLIFCGGGWGGVKLVSCTVFHSKK